MSISWIDDAINLLGRQLDERSPVQAYDLLLQLSEETNGEPRDTEFAQEQAEELAHDRLPELLRALEQRYAREFRVGPAPNYQISRAGEVPDHPEAELQRRKSEAHAILTSEVTHMQAPTAPIIWHYVQEHTLLDIAASQLNERVFGLIGSTGMGCAISAIVNVASIDGHAPSGLWTAFAVGLCATIVGGIGWALAFRTQKGLLDRARASDR